MFGFGIGNRQSAKKQQARFRLYKPLVDVLESRTLLAWTPIGPLTQTGWPVPNSIFAEPVAGRVTSLAYSTNFDGQNHNEIIMGTAGGGIWIWAEGQNPLNWRPITETFTDFAMPSANVTNPVFIEATKAIGAVAVDPRNSRVIYAGTGEANYSSESRYGAGILRSADAGATWKLATGQAPGQSQFFGQSVSKIFVDPTDSRCVYAAVVPATQGGALNSPAYRNIAGIYESRDSGGTWAQIWNGGANAPVIVTDMDFTIVGQGINRQINIFAAVSNPYDNGQMGAGQGYYTGNGSGVWIGTFTPGAADDPRAPIRNWNFTNQVRQEANARRIALAASRDFQGSQIIVAAVVAQNGTLARVIRSGNNGQNWNDISPTNTQRTAVYADTAIGWYALAIAMDTTAPRKVYLAGQGKTPLSALQYSGGGFIDTIDNGRTWQAVDGPAQPNILYWRPGSGNNIAFHPDHHAILVITDNRGGRLYDGNDGGVWKWDRAGVPGTFEDWNGAAGGVGLQTNLVNAVGVRTGTIVNPANTTVWEGSHDNGLSERTGITGASAWVTSSQRAAAGVFPFFRPNGQIAGDAGMVRVTPAGGAYMVMNSVNNRLVMWVRHPDENFDWSMISPAGAQVGPTVVNMAGPIGNDATFPFYPVFSVSPTLHNNVRVNGAARDRFRVAVGSQFVWQREFVPGPNPNDNWVFQWRPLTVNPNGTLRQLDGTQQVTAITYQNDNTLFVGFDNGQLWRLNGGVWARYDAGVNWPLFPIRSIAFDPQNANHVYIAIDSFSTGQQVYRSTDGTGAAWTNLSGNGMTQIPPLPARTLIIDHVGMNPVAVLVGNDAGVYVADNAQNNQWRRFDTALPFVEVTDLQRVGTSSTILAATYGRGIWSFTPAAMPVPALNPGSDSYGIEMDGTLTVTADVGVLQNDFPDSESLQGATSVVATGPSFGQLVLHPDGSFVYTPNPGFEGEDIFTYTVTDRDGHSGIAPVYIEVETPLAATASMNHAPVGTNGVVATQVGVPYSFTTANFGFTDPNDSPPNNFMAVKITTLPDVGTITDNGAQVNAGDFISVADIIGGRLTFAPATNGIGAPYASFTFQVQDDGGTGPGAIDTDPNPKTMTINVNQATPFILWRNPDAIMYGTALSATQLNATASDASGVVLSGTFVYTPGAGTVLSAGLGQTLSVTFTPNDTIHYTTATATVAIDVNLRPGVGGRAWNDADGDGFQDSTEQAMANVSVELHYANGNLIATTTTDSNGIYQFPSIGPGDYYVLFVKPAGFEFSPQDPTVDPLLDSDADYTGRTETFTLVSGDIAQYDVGLVPGQWASSVVGFSSQWSTTSWAATQALGVPDTFTYGDIPTAWAPLPMNGTLEWLRLGFTTPVYANGVTIRETDGNGFVYQVDLADTNGGLHTIWAGSDPSQPGTPVDFLINFSATSYLVQGVKIYVDTNHDLTTWEEIDAALLRGSTSGGGFSAPSQPGPGSTGTLTRAFSIQHPNLGPFATFSSSSQRISLGGTVTIMFSNQHDRSGAAAPASAFTYSFDFNNDGIFTDPGDIRDSTSPSAVFRPTRRGWNVIHGRMKDASGHYTDFWVRVFVD